jgi:hypothetical protein
MSRSRSSFDLSSAIATAASLSVVVPEEQPAAQYRGVPLVSFGPTAAGTVMPPAPDPTAAEAPVSTRESSRSPPPTPPPPTPPAPAPVAEEAPASPPAEIEAGPIETARRPPKLPDLSEIKSPTVRCQKIIEWIVEAVGAADVFIADAAGLPLGGAIDDVGNAEARLGATGVVASAVAHLAAAIPGNSSALFEMHVGDGPFFQLIGFDVAAQSYVVGFQRPTPLGFRQAHAVRLACRHALGPIGHDGGDPHTPGPAGHDGGDPHTPGPAGHDGGDPQPSGEPDPATHPRGHVAMEEAQSDPGGET